MTGAYASENTPLTSADTDAIANAVSGLFSLLADAMPQIVWAANPDGSHFYFNRRWYEYSGLSESESLGFGFIPVLHSDDLLEALERWRAASSAGEDYHAEYRIRGRDGSFRWFVGRAKPVYDSGTGNIRLWVGTCADIDDQRSAIEALRESESRLSLALRSAKLGTWEYDFSKDGFFASDRTLELFGQTEDRLYPIEEWTALVHAGDRVQTRTTFLAYLHCEPPYGAPEATIALQYRSCAKDGTIRYVSAMGARRYDLVESASGEQSLTRVVGVIQDVTEEHETLQALHDAANTLRARESQYRFLFDTVTHGVVYANADGCIIDANPAAERILGLTLAEMQGMHTADWRWRARREGGYDFPKEEQPIPTALRTGRPVRDVPLEIFHPAAEHYRTLLVSAVPYFRDGDERPYLVYAHLEDVTERRAAQEELQESESRYRTLTEVLPQMIWTADRSGAVTYCNQFWYDYTGFDEAQSLGDRWMSAIHTEDRDRTYQTWRSAVALGTDYEMEIRFRQLPEGVYRWFLARGRAIRDPEMGYIRQWLCTAVDIDDRKQASELIRRSEERFRSLVEATAQVVWSASPSGEVVADQVQWAGYTGQSFEEHRHYGWLKAIYPEDRELMTIRWSYALSNRTVCTMEHRLRNRNGEYRWFILRAVPVFNVGGDVREWVCTETDITDRKRAERALRESEERFRWLVEATVQIIWHTKSDGTFSTDQLGWSRFTGQPFAEHRGLGWLQAIHPDDRVATQRGWNSAVMTRTHYDSEHRVRRADGEYRYMAVRAVPITNSDGSIREWIGIHSDITERKEAEQELEKYARQQARVAETLQRSLLNIPPAHAFPGLILATRYEAAWTEAKVGGDFFDVFALDGGRTAIIVGDVTGKGLKAAEHTGQIKYALRAFLRENPDPGDALPRLNKLITDTQRLDVQSENTVAMAVVTAIVFDAATGAVRLSSGGAEATLHYVAATGTVEEIETSGVVVGAYPSVDYTVIEKVMQPGDIILLATDGITEARRDRRDFFGIEGVAAAMEQAALRTTDPVAIADAVIAAAKAFTSDGILHDDVCVVAARRN